MELEATERRDRSLLRRFHTRIAAFAVAAGIAAAVAAGLAFARTQATTLGTGVVVIDTNLGYEGGQAAGTGMVLTSSGEILTNNHVIRGATTIKVVLPGTGRSYTAKVVGYDMADDVAVLQAAGASNLRTVAISTSGVKVGQAVRALGNAGGTGSLVSARGTVTALGRAITVSDDQGGSERLTGLIETNAALQAGDSGGPLLNAAGRVVGMDTAASLQYGGFRTMASGDGYAIPIAKAVTIAKKIEAGQASAAIHVGGTAFLGIQVVASDYGDSGATIAQVVSGSPAESAGLVAGDVITSFAGHTVASPTALGALVAAAKPGAKVAVTYLDEPGTTQTATVTLGSGPPQ